MGVISRRNQHLKWKQASMAYGSKHCPDWENFMLNLKHCFFFSIVECFWFMYGYISNVIYFTYTVEVLHIFCGIFLHACLTHVVCLDAMVCDFNRQGSSKWIMPQKTCQFIGIYVYTKENILHEETFRSCSGILTFTDINCNSVWSYQIITIIIIFMDI